MKELWDKYKSIILYIVFGVGTTIINLISYWLFADKLGLAVAISTALAWVFSVTFAFVTNKLFVFGSKSFQFNLFVKEAISFFSCRFLTGVLDIIIMVVGVDMLGFYDLAVKIVSNVIVTVLNYVASKLVIFKKVN